MRFVSYFTFLILISYVLGKSVPKTLPPGFDANAVRTFIAEPIARSLRIIFDRFSTNNQPQPQRQYYPPYYPPPQYPQYPQYPQFPQYPYPFPFPNLNSNSALPFLTVPVNLSQNTSPVYNISIGVYNTTAVTGAVTSTATSGRSLYEIKNTEPKFTTTFADDGTPIINVEPIYITVGEDNNKTNGDEHDDEYDDDTYDEHKSNKLYGNGVDKLNQLEKLTAEFLLETLLQQTSIQQTQQQQTQQQPVQQQQQPLQQQQQTQLQQQQQTQSATHNKPRVQDNFAAIYLRNYLANKK